MSALNPHYLTEVARLHAQGMSDPEMARELGLDPSTINRYRTRHDPPLPINRAKPYKRKSSFDPDLMRRLHAEKYTDADMARALGVGQSTVSRWRSKLGLPINNPAEQMRAEVRHLVIDLGFSDFDLARYYQINVDAAQARRHRAGVRKRDGYARRTTPEKLEFALTLLRDEQMSYHSAADVADVPYQRLRQEFPGYGWTPQQAGQVSSMTRRLEHVIHRAWPAYAEKYAA